MSDPARQQLLVDVVTKYHREGLTQAQIGKDLGISRQTVSRMLGQAQDQGVVSIQINDPSQVADEIAQRVRVRFGLQAATVVDSGDSDPERRHSETTRRAAVGCFERMTAATVISMLWGPTVLAFSQRLPRGDFPNLTICQMGGMTPTIPGQNALDPAVSAAAEALGAKADLVAAPLYVDTAAIRAAITSDSRINATLDRARSADMYIFSVGLATTEGGLYQSGYLTKPEIEQLEADGAVGELCGLFYSITGEPCGAELEARTIALSRDDIRAIPQRILIASQEEKAGAVLGAFAGGYATEAFLDIDLAKAVLKLAEDPGSTPDDHLTCPKCHARLRYDGRSLSPDPPTIGVASGTRRV
jgi:deoxyribonucleoside regulator